MNIVLPEIISVGIYQSQFAAKNKAVSKNRKATMFEIEIPIEKGGTSYIDAEEAAIAQDLVICAKPGQTRHTRFPFKCYYIHMILKEGVLYDMLMKAPSFIKTDKYDKYVDIYKKLCNYYDSGIKEDEIILQGLILQIVHTISRDLKKAEINNNRNGSNYSSIEKAIKYIGENLSSALSLEAVSAYVGLSPIHFHNSFKYATGKTLRTYVEERRIKMAADMLITTDHTLTKIAYDCGFSSQSYFSYAFKRKMKLTPREYAKKIFSQYEEKSL